MLEFDFQLRTRNPLLWLYRSINNWVNQNPEVAQFWGSIISSVITLAALLVTVFFSWEALSESQKQNTNATQQLELAKQQFVSSQKQHTADSIDAATKDKIANDRFIRDTIKQNQREKAQERRNHLQDAANEQQYELNKSQLKAVQIQAQTVKEQAIQQQLQYKQQVYEQRPIFSIDSVSINKINSVRSTIRFTFENVGIRPAHVDSAILSFYNPKLLCFSVTSSLSNLDLISQRNSILTPLINIYNECLSSNLTIFYLLIYYKDVYTSKSKIEPIFFIYEYIKPHQFIWKRYEGYGKSDFIKLLKKKKILVIE